MKSPIRREAGQSVDELAEQLAAQPENRLSARRDAYPEIAAQVKAEAVANAVSLHQRLLDNGHRKRVSLRDTEAVKAAASTYMEACAKAGAVPTMLSFSASLGLSRKSVYRFLQLNPNHETTKFIDSLLSAWAGILSQLALSRQLSEPVSIFLLKNSGQGLTDRQEIEVIPPESPYQDDRTPEEIAQKYLSGMVADYEPDGSEDF